MDIIILNESNVEYWFDDIRKFVSAINNEPIERLYQNLNYCIQRIAAGLETSMIAVENEQIAGVLTAFSGSDQFTWSMALLYVDENKRRNGIGTKLLAEFEKQTGEKIKQYKIMAQAYKKDKYSNIFYLSKAFDFEGCSKALETENDMYVWGKIITWIESSN